MKMWIGLFIVGLLLVAGCKDISDSYKPGSFGKSPEEQKIVDYYKAKFGDLTESGSPRILEPLMSSNVENYIPVDKVSKFSKDSEKLYAWFVYDNFKEGDVIEVEWTYLDEDYVIHTFKSSAGGDFGRGMFVLEKPDEGWPLGDYRVTIKGSGASAKLDFEIINGATVSEPLPFNIPAGEVKTETNTADVKGVSASGFQIKSTKCSFDGKWDTNWGEMSLDVSGDKVTGTYTYDSGKITGKITGNVLVGKWSESPSYAEPNDAGDIEFLLSDDCKSFSGNWRYGSEGSWSGGWTGTEISD